MRKVKVTEHFFRHELDCTCKKDCGAYMDMDFMYKIESLRKLYGKPLTPSSAARCPDRNKEVGGVKNSHHLSVSGKHGSEAIDFEIHSSTDRGHLITLALKLGFFGGIGVSGTFVHLDSRRMKRTEDGLKYPKIWTY